MYTINNLRFSYASKCILEDIHTTISAHRITAIIGPNGCGKSTLLKHLSKQIPSTGTIEFNGHPLEDLTGQEYAKQVAVLSQMRDAMIDEFQVEDIVLMGRYPYKSRFGTYSKEDYRLRDHYMNRVGIDHLRHETIQHLSGGELQRVFIAKALCQEPSVLLLDEPTNHLDAKYKIALMEELKRFQGTVVVVLHDLQLAARYADHILLMQNGHIVREGTPSAVLTADQLETVFEVPFTIINQNGTCYIQY